MVLCVSGVRSGPTCRAAYLQRLSFGAQPARRAGSNHEACGPPGSFKSSPKFSQSLSLNIPSTNVSSF